MRRIRVIPVLLLQNGGLVKGKKFRKHQYVGDPINAVKIFNEKEVDELAVLDISATISRRSPNIKQIAEIASEAFMPLSYGGGITKIEDVDELFYFGIEKVILNSSVFLNPGLITTIANKYGIQSVVVSIDVKKDWFGRNLVYTNCGNKNTNTEPGQLAKKYENLGAGEILLTSIDQEGTYRGYHIELIKEISSVVSIPIIANGGAGSMIHLKKAIESGASAVAAGNMFVFQRPLNAVLISYPNLSEIEDLNLLNS
jgi:imidazole glycerol-phosphate synthase subunit HisF